MMLHNTMDGGKPATSQQKIGNDSAQERDAKELQETYVTVYDNDNVVQQDSLNVIYRIHESPPVFMWPVYGMQQALMCVSGSLSLPFIISSYICAGHLPDVRAQLLSITFFMCGVATLLQTVVGIRLPIIQGSSYAFLPSIAAMMQLEKWTCPDPDRELNQDEEEPWLSRMREVQGNLLLASLTQVVLGATGVVGFLLRFIGPITIAPTIALIGMGFTSVVTDFSEKHFGAAAVTAGLILVFSLWLGRLQILLGACCGWLFCLILTEADVLPNNSTELAFRARTDINLKVLDTAPWFRFPYPFQFGLPTMSVSGFFGMFLGTMASVLESMGDYYAAARVSGAPPPPPHAVNRGIAMEGFSSVISSMVGAGHATTSYSENIAAITVTRVASRRVFQVAGLILVLFGIFTKIGAVMTLIPDPVIGGLNAVLLGTLIAVGVATLRFVDMESPRNVTVIGLTFMLGLAVPQWVNAEPGRINTGDDMADQVLSVLLGTPMFVGGLLGAFLDNIAPGTLEERGITKWQEDNLSENNGCLSQRVEDDTQNQTRVTYDLPFVSNFLRRMRCCAFVPFLPSYNGFRCSRGAENDVRLSTIDASPPPQAIDNKSFE